MRDGSWSPCDMEPLRVLDGVNQCGGAVWIRSHEKLYNNISHILKAE